VQDIKGYCVRAVTSSVSVGVPEHTEASSAEQNNSISLVAIDALRAADSPRLAGENSEHVRALAEADSALQPIVVHRKTMRVVDGMHRLSAARLRGQAEIEVIFVTGDKMDLFVLAVQSNVKHGLPLTLADRKAAASRILASHSHWSDRRIASVTGLSPSTVGTIRSHSTDGVGHSDRRQGVDGAERPLSTAAGRSRAWELLTERPNASVREIAAIAGISPSTVHDVRQRLREGREPIPPSQRKADRQPRHLRVASTDETRHYGAEISVTELGIDPTLRHTEDGRLLLRLLSAKSVLEQRIAQLAAIVPPHLADPVADLACRTGDAWHDFSHRVAQVKTPVPDVGC
jgi:ParB-like chromosome segregation protein Spo0J